MEVWDPKDKPTVFSQIKKLSQTRTGLLRVARYIIYPGILFILVLLYFALLTGCSTMEWPWKKNIKAQEKEFICTKIDCGDEDIDQLVEDEQNTIACIKLQPECKLDEEN